MNTTFLKRALGIVVALGALVPTVMFAFSIDATSNTALLCDAIPGNTDCHSYTKVYWLVPSNTSPVTVSDTALTGFIWAERLGWIKLNPSTPPTTVDPTDPCKNKGVVNTTQGVLCGMAYGDIPGWVNFKPTAASNLGVTIDSNGKFSGWAWMSNYGWMKFDCSGGDGSPGCVKTDWRPTTIVDSSSSNGSGCPSCHTDTSTSSSNGDGNTHTDTSTSSSNGDGTHQTHTTSSSASSGGIIIEETHDTTGGGGGGDPCLLENPTDVFGVLIGETIRSYCETKKSINTTTDAIKNLFNSSIGDTTTKTIIAVGIVSGATTSILSALFLNPISFSEIFLIPVRLWALFLAAMGLKKRRRPWGTVYDSVTKQPLDPAQVVLRNQDGIEVASTLTDLDGRYGFVVTDPGNYTLTAHKTNYVFPSQKLVGRDHDELYRDLYFGEHFIVNNAGEIVFKNIPMDPEKFDWNEFTKKKKHLMRFYSNRQHALRIFSDTLFGICFFITAVAVLAAPKTYNIATFLLYVMLYFVRVYGKSSRPYGYVVEKETGYPISYAIIRITNASGVEIMHRITDAEGRYYALLPKGDYHIRIDRKLPDATYKTIVADQLVSVADGNLAEKFLVATQVAEGEVKLVAPTTLIHEYKAQVPTAQITPAENSTENTSKTN
jgi:hypothetical protein